MHMADIFVISFQGIREYLQNEIIYCFITSKPVIMLRKTIIINNKIKLIVAVKNGLFKFVSENNKPFYLPPSLHLAEV